MLEKAQHERHELENEMTAKLQTRSDRVSELLTQVQKDSAKIMMKVQEFLNQESEFEPAQAYADLERQALVHAEVARLFNMLLIAKDDSVTMTEVSVRELT